jgi:hypothetical protein
MCEVNCEVDLLEGNIHLYLDSLPWMPPKVGLVAALKVIAGNGVRKPRFRLAAKW